MTSLDRIDVITRYLLTTTSYARGKKHRENIAQTMYDSFLTFRLLKCIEKLTLLPVEKKNQLILRRINQTIFHKARFISLTSKQVIYPTSNLKPYSDYLNEEVTFIYLEISTTIKEISKYIIVEIY